MRYLFEDFVLDVKKHELRRGEGLIAVEPQVFALLVHLIEQRERVVSREELIETIWEGRFVSDSVVSSRIKSARKALGDDGRTQRLIKTLHGTGFRFVAPVREEVESVGGDRQADIKTPAPVSKNAPSVPTQKAAETPAAPSPSAQLTKPPVLALIAAMLIAAVGFLFWHFNAPPADPQSPALDNPTAALPESERGAVQNSASVAIAVMPFDDFSQAGDQEYFADGIAEELLNALAKVDGLRVTSRASSFAFKGRETNADEIAQTLNVSHLLKGSVRKAGDTVRITAKLIDAKNDMHLWTQTYDRALTAENLFAVQDEISQAIVSELKGRIDLPALNPALKTDSTQAYDAYLRGRSLIAQRTADSVRNGIAELNRAAALDPDFAPAHSALVDAYVLAFSYAGMANKEAGALAAPHAARALALAPNAPGVLAAKGRALSIFEGNDTEAINYYTRAIAANPNFADAHRLLGLAHSSLSHVDAAKASFETAQRLNPLAPVIFSNLFRTNWDKGDLEAMLALGQESFRLNPDTIFARRVLGGALRESGNYAAAHRLFKDNEALFGAGRDQLGAFYHLVGRDDLAAPYADAYLKALIALRNGDKQGAAALIRGGYEFQEVAILRWAGEIDAAYALVKQDIARRRLLSDETQIAVRYQTFDIYYAIILMAKKDPAGEVYRARLAARFDGKTPADFRLRDSFYAGALWRMMNGETDAALTWLDALIEAGHVWPDIVIEPLFDPIRDSEGFQTRIARLEDNAARHRAAADLRLTDPGDG